MQDELDRAIAVLAGKIVQSIKPDDALKYTQSALNLAHVKGLLTAIEKDQRKPKGAGS